MNNNEKVEYLKSLDQKLNIMEVCGTHTMAISKFGLRTNISKNINLISGPGCPVCVTPDFYIDYVYNISKEEDILIATYGDMIRVPGSDTKYSLEKAKAEGATVKMVYSSMDALNLAKENKNKKVVFLGIGFETTMPATAIAVLEARRQNITNFFVLSIHKKVEPVMRAILDDKTLNIHGFICPGNVAVIIGEKGFEFLNNYNKNGVITGFEYGELIDGIYTLVKNIKDGNNKIENRYQNAVRYEGNKEARKFIDKVFTLKDDYWRGLGLIPNSGFKLKDEFKSYDIETYYKIEHNEKQSKSLCRCGDVLKGKIKPNQCPLFRKICNPENPVGPCMVSSEGSCSAYYKYENI
ncbi:MAG: hydrogenase formation protein HypD [Clostridiaceae bacterium]